MVALFVLAAAVILVCAKPFADSLIGAGTQLGIDRFLLVQWLAPLASEAPEFIIAIIFATRGKGTAAIATLISSKVNQWTLLMGSLPVAFMAGGGGTSLVLDGRQIEEVLLTATQTMMGVALILSLRFHRNTAWVLLALFLVQFPIPSTAGRLALCAAYGVLAVAGLVVNRGHLLATLRAPFVDVDDDAATVSPGGPACSPPRSDTYHVTPVNRHVVKFSHADSRPCRHRQTSNHPVSVGHGGDFRRPGSPRESTGTSFPSHGLVEGDAVAILMENNEHMHAVMWAARRSGLYYVPINIHLTPAEAAYIIENSGAKAVIGSAALRETCVGLAGQVSLPELY